MMITLTFTVDAGGPFAVGTGQPSGGLDDTVRSQTPLPASEIKGAMRAAACVLLDVNRGAAGPGGVLNAIFGAEGSSGAWAWTDAGPEDCFLIEKRSRTRLSQQTGMVTRESLAATQSAWVAAGKQPTFAIEQLAHLDDGHIKEHVALLVAAAHAVTAVGSWRTRGMGAVSFRPADWNEVQQVGAARDTIVAIVAGLANAGAK